MHEWALAEAVVSAVARVVHENGGLPVRAVRVLFGELQAVDPQAFRAGLESCLQDTPFSVDLFHIETEKASFACNRCGREWLLESVSWLGEEEREAIHFLPETAHAVLRCPGCGSPDFRLTKGRGVSISSIELEDRR
jgi:hydrogenase nickel incorporation protein HypA/HybF